MTSLREGGARPGKSSLIGVAIFSAWSRPAGNTSVTNNVRTADADAIIRGPRSAAFLADRSEQVH